MISNLINSFVFSITRELHIYDAWYLIGSIRMMGDHICLSHSSEELGYTE